MGIMRAMYSTFIVPKLKLFEPFLDPCFSRNEATRA